jgi:hypothetical protein
VAFGPAICACCGAPDGIEEHHLYLRADGCPDDLTVWLCATCHGRAHSVRRRIDISAATKAALAAAKARGVRLGNPNLQPGTRAMALAAGRVAAVAKAAKVRALAADLTPVIDSIRAEGVGSLGGIAAALAARGIPSPSGRGGWHAATVHRVLSRA